MTRGAGEGDFGGTRQRGGQLLVALLVVLAVTLAGPGDPATAPQGPRSATTPPTAGLLGPATAHAAAKPSKSSQGRLDDLVGFLQDTQNDDGGYGGSPGADSDPMISAWVGIGLAAAGINPQDQTPPGSKSTSVATFLAKHGPIRVGGAQPVTTEYARIGMFANAAGMDARKFGGRDYVTPLLARQSGAPSTVGDVTVPPGWFPHVAGGSAPGVNDTIFAIFFLSGLQDKAVSGPIRQATAAVEAMQRADGTWPATRPGDGTNVDMTGAAVQALCVAGRCKSDAVRRAVAYLREHQQPDGGWQAGDLADEQAGESNSGTTPWVVQALWAVGEDPATWKTPGGKDPLEFLAALQRRDGSIMWRQSRDMNPTWMTAYSAPAFAGHAWPVPAPPRAAEVKAAKKQADEKRAAQKRSAARKLQAERTAGNAGEASEGDGSTATGGGGRGADLFSRPQPQSQGATTGGVRDTEREQERQKSTKGEDGATGTAAASGAGDSGGVQNVPPPPTSTSGEDGAGIGELISGQVVEAPRGTEGRQLDDAVAAGLRTAKAGGTATPWAATALGGLMAICVLIGMRLETRPGSRWGR